MRNLILLTVLFCSCASSSVTYLGTSRYMEKPAPEMVKIILDEKELPEKYEKFAIITTSYLSDADKSMYKNARKKAAKIGADAIMIRSKEDASSGEQIAGAILGVPSSDKTEFIAIRFIE